MASPKFMSMPNFRSVSNELAPKSVGSKIYRSSRPDLLTIDEIESFQKLGIKSIIDLRAAREYGKASGTKLLDSYYQPIRVKIPLWGEVPKKGLELIEIKPKKDQTTVVPEKYIGKHFLMDFFRLNFVSNTFNKAPLWFQLYSLLFLIYDLIFRTGYKYFVRLFAKKILNDRGLSGQYIDMVEFSQAAIYSGKQTI